MTLRWAGLAIGVIERRAMALVTRASSAARRDSAFAVAGGGLLLLGMVLRSSIA